MNIVVRYTPGAPTLDVVSQTYGDGLKVVGWNPFVKLVAVKQPGHAIYRGQGQPQGYAPAHIRLFRLDKDLGDGMWEITDIMDIRPR